MPLQVGSWPQSPDDRQSRSEMFGDNFRTLLLDRQQLLEIETRSSPGDIPTNPTNFLITKFLEGFNWEKLKSDVNVLISWKSEQVWSTVLGLLSELTKASGRFWFIMEGQVGKNQSKVGETCVAEKTAPFAKMEVVFGLVLSILKTKRVALALNYGCRISSVVCLLYCETCKLGYVGATSRELSKRLSGHVGKINCQAD